jgi:hypothetical protein
MSDDIADLLQHPDWSVRSRTRRIEEAEQRAGVLRGLIDDVVKTYDYHGDTLRTAQLDELREALSPIDPPLAQEEQS